MECLGGDGMSTLKRSYNVAHEGLDSSYVDKPV
jgi:hypothetical protein